MRSDDLEMALPRCQEDSGSRHMGTTFGQRVLEALGFPRYLIRLRPGYSSALLNSRRFAITPLTVIVVGTEKSAYRK